MFQAVDAETRSFQNVLAELRSTKIGNSLSCPAAILHGRSLVTGEPVAVDHSSVKATLLERQAKYSQNYHRSHKVKMQRALVLGERCWTTGTNNKWTECYVTGIDKEKRCYKVVFDDTEKTFRCTRSQLKPHGPDIPHISDRYIQQNPNPVLSEEAVSSKNLVTSATGRGNPEEHVQNLILSGLHPNLERDTAVSLISHAPAKSMKFPENPVSQKQYIPLRLHKRPHQPKPAFHAHHIDLLTSAPETEPPARYTETKEQ